MRWEKDDKFIEINEAISTSCNGPVSTVCSNAFNRYLPLQWRSQVPQSDSEAHRQLIESVTAWAECVGFKRR
jgi:hypothetical protein